MVIDAVQNYAAGYGLDYYRLQRKKSGEYDFFNYLSISLPKGSGVVLTNVGTCPDTSMEFWGKGGRKVAKYDKNVSEERVIQVLKMLIEEEEKAGRR